MSIKTIFCPVCGNPQNFANQGASEVNKVCDTCADFLWHKRIPIKEGQICSYYFNTELTIPDPKTVLVIRQREVGSVHWLCWQENGDAFFVNEGNLHPLLDPKEIVRFRKVMEERNR